MAAGEKPRQQTETRKAAAADLGMGISVGMILKNMRDISRIRRFGNGANFEIAESRHS